MFSLLCTLLLILTLCSSTVFTFSAAMCISEDARNDMISDMKHRARKIRMPKPIFRCLLKQLVAVPPTKVSTPEGQHYCYEEEVMKKSLQQGISACIFNKRRPSSSGRGSVRVASLSLECLGSSGEPQACSPSLFYATTCSCYSGCHYCCIVASLGAGSWCAQLYCPNGGWCA